MVDCYCAPGKNFDQELKLSVRCRNLTVFPTKSRDGRVHGNTAAFPTLPDDGLVFRLPQYGQIAANGTIPAFMDFSYAMLPEMTARGLATDEHLDLFSTARAVYS